MMTLILIVSAALIAFVIMLRIDMHKYKYRKPVRPDQATEQASQPSNTPSDAASQHQEPK
jgi:hypothetical protein